ncbi:G-protein coupled receptor 4-like [Micropterus dolomieu]|uniref:G-protein coupled receptor 4-like n=1 Tax=Micropterus dolomieu TaxID=147949 RepID=UPI001E8D0B65|nr:G-protein coupled receptor 4-like [Micropterus dolomieu]
MAIHGNPEAESSSEAPQVSLCRMEGLYSNSTLPDQSFNYSNITCNYQKSIHEYLYNEPDVIYVVTCVIIVVGLPLTLVAISALYSMVRSDHVAPIYLINLLISDLIQLCCMIVEVAPPEDEIISVMSFCIYLSGQIASVYFMVCIALERYLVIAHPLWYRFRRTIRSSVAVCVLVWVLPPFCVVLFFFVYLVPAIIYPILLLLPFPLLIFSLVGTLKALSASISVPSDEKRRIVGVLVLVLLIYTMFLPAIIWYLEVFSQERLFLGSKNDLIHLGLSFIFVRLSPLADLFLYVFMRKGFIDKLLASVCCCRMDSNDISSPSV